MEQESKQKRQKGKIEHWKIVTFYLVCYDIVAINAAYFLGLLIRFDFSFNAIPKEFLFSFFVFAPFYTVLTIVIYARLHLYNSLWKFAGFSELNRLAVAALVTTALQVIGMTLFVHHMPVSYFIFGALLQFCLTVAVRFAYRYITLERNRHANSVKCKSNALIIGAGSAGQMLIKEMKGSAKNRHSAALRNRRRFKQVGENRRRTASRRRSGRYFGRSREIRNRPDFFSQFQAHLQASAEIF